MKRFLNGLFRFRNQKSIPIKMKKLGKFLTEQRKELGMSIRQVAIETTLSPSYLCKLEVGDTFKTISLENLLKLTKFYKLPIETFLEKASFLENSGEELPEFSSYLRSKYHYSPQAIRDMEIVLKLVMEKYNTKHQ